MNTMKKTPLFERHVQLGATMVDFGGWDMPVQYTNVMDEHNATRNDAGVFDICHMGEIVVKGNQAFDVLQKSMSRNMNKLSDGKMVLAVMCNENGGILDDLTIYRFNEKSYTVVVNASNEEKDYNWIKKVCEDGRFDAEVINISSKIAKLDLQGPKSQQILQKITNFDLNQIKFYEFGCGKIDGIDAVISRSGYTGEDGFEIYFNWDYTVQIWDKLFEVGKEEKLKPCGLGARDTLRLECAMNLYGHEMDETKTPLQARYGWVVDYDKEFIGKDAIVKQKEEGVKEKLIGFEMIDNAIARNGYKFFKDGTEVGFVTSGSLSPTLKKKIGLGYIKTEHTAVDTEFEVNVRDKMYKAKVVKLPFYKRK